MNQSKLMEAQKSNVPKLRFPEFNGAWEEKRLGKKASFKKGKGISKADIELNGITSCIRYGELYTLYGQKIMHAESKTNVSTQQLLMSKGGEVLVPASGETAIDIATATVVLQENIALGGDLNIIYSDIDGHFLALSISGIKKITLARMAQGNSVVHLNSDHLSSLKLNLPTLPEQKKIANFLGAVDDKIAQLTRKKELLETYKKGVSQQLFSQHIRFKQDDGQDFPDWEEKRLGELGITFNGLSGKSANDFGSGLPFITYLQVFNASFVDTNRCGLVDIKEHERQNKVEFGDVIFTTSSETAHEVGFASAVICEIGEVYLNSFCFGFRPNCIEQLTPNFSRFAFRSGYFMASIFPLAQGSTRFNLSKKSFLKLKIRLPHPDEQRKIADFLSAIDTKIDLTAQELAQAKTFKKGLLQQMFV